jgi:hypothetical protein
MNEVDDEMNFCAALAPAWADEIRHPDMHTTEFWRCVGVVRSDDSHEVVAISVVQNGPSATPQIAVGGLRYTLLEARDYYVTLGSALNWAEPEEAALISR